MRHRLLAFAVAAFAFSPAWGAQLQNTFVSGKGADTGNCALAAPCRSFQYALSQTLPNGNVLIAENNTMRVTERDPQGNVLWEYRVLTGQPIAVQRLPNGNTFIGSYNQVMEITPNKEIVYRHQPGPDFYVFSAARTRSGQIVAMTAQGVLWEMDAMTGREIRKIPVGQGGGWSSVEPLPGGNYLVASMNNNQIREIDAAGNTLSSSNFPGGFRAAKRPNGNTVPVNDCVADKGPASLAVTLIG